MTDDVFTKALESLLNAADAKEHDSVVYDSSTSYTPEKLEALGLKMDLNVNSKTRFVGNASNPIYPDIVVWRPDFPTSDKGKAVIIEKIETRQGIEKNWEIWPRFSNIGVIFNLIIPASELANVQHKLTSLGINSTTHLQTYTYNSTTSHYEFDRIT